jgi:tetratricopeptide (TPR) repeat protein/DNA-binding CsgD family transcriptional regulator
MKPLFFIINLVWFVILPWNIAFSGRLGVDSLHAELFRTDDITKKVNLYLLISKVFEETNSDSAVLFWKEAQNLAKRLKSEKLLAAVYMQSAFFAVKQNHLDQAFLDFTLAAKYFGNSGNPDQFIRMEAFLGNICLARDNLSGAMNYYMEVIEYSEKKTDYPLLPFILNNVGNIYIESEDYNTALGYFTKALWLFRKYGDTVNTIYPLMNLGVIYFQIGSFEISRDYVRQAIGLAVKSNDKIMEARGWMILGQILGKEMNYTAALEMLERSYEIQQKDAIGYKGPGNIVYSELLIQIGETWMHAGNYTRAVKYSLEGYRMAKEMKQVKQAMLAAQQLGLIHKYQAHSDSALYYYMIYMDLSDELAKSRNLRAVKLMEIKQEYEKKRKENELAMTIAKSTKRSILIIYLSSGIGFLAVILILILMLKIEKQRKRQAELEKRNLNEKLSFQNKELTTNVMYLARLNELVLAVAEKLESLNLASSSTNDRIIKSVISDLKQTSSIDTWKEFEVRFQSVHVDFYKNLSEKFPELSPNELKICAFLRLNMSTKEICALTHQSQDSIRMARSRLRQKLGISKDENLVAFLTQV